MKIEPQPGYVRIIVDRLANPFEARAIAEKILDTADEADRMPRVPQ